MSQDTLRLYGLTVSAADYEILKRITNALVGLTTPAERIDRARRRCLRVAEALLARLGLKPPPGRQYTGALAGPARTRAQPSKS